MINFPIKLLAKIYECDEKEIEFLDHIVTGIDPELVDNIPKDALKSLNELREIIFKYGCESMRIRLNMAKEYTDDLIPEKDFKLLENDHGVPYVHCINGERYGNVLTETDILFFNFDTGFYIDNWQRENYSFLWEPEEIDFDLDEMEE